MLSIKITGYMVLSDGYGPVQRDQAAPTVVTFLTLSSWLIHSFPGPNQPYSPTTITIKCQETLKGRYVTIQKINTSGNYTGPLDLFLNVVAFFAA